MKQPHVKPFLTMLIILIRTSILNPAVNENFRLFILNDQHDPTVCYPINKSTPLFHSCRKQLMLHEVKQAMKPPLCANGARNSIHVRTEKKCRNCS